MNRSWSVLTVKSIDEDQRVITGIASTPSTDRVGDVVEPKGAKFNLPIPFLMDHGKNGSDDSIGHVISAQVKADGIHIKAKIEQDAALPYLDAAWAKIKKGLVRGLSIGFKGIEVERIKDAGIRFKQWEWLELSAVVIPANAEASILTIKSADVSHQSPASGAVTTVASHKWNAADMPKIVDALISSGVSGNSTSKGLRMKTSVAEQIGNYEAERAYKMQQIQALLDASADESRPLNDTEQKQYDEISAEVEGVDKHVSNLRRHEKLLLTATPVTSEAGNDPDIASRVRQDSGRPGSIIFSKSNRLPGTGFTRLCMAVMAGKGSESDTERYIQRNFRDTPEVGLAYKAAVAAGTTTDANWAAPLVNYTDLASEFIALLRPRTILGRMPSLRRVPFNVRMAKLASGATGGWVGEGLSKPVSALDFDTVTFPFYKMACIVVLTQELVRFSSPQAEATTRDELLSAIAQLEDVSFIDPSIAGTATVQPASITNGLTAIANPGTTVATITAALSTALSNAATANIDLSTGVWVMHPRSAVYLSTVRTTQDILGFPGMGLTGGTLLGFPVIVSGNVPADTGSSRFIAFIVQNEVFLADDGVTRIDASDQASLQMDSAPSAGAQSLVSLWQNNMVGLRAERFANWARRRTEAVQLIEDVSF